MSEPSDRQTGAQLNERWGVGAAHALYIHDGHWYHQLKEFPGALFDRNGYILFQTEADFRSCPHISIGKDVSVPKPGISAIPGYVRVVTAEARFWALCANPSRYRIREAIDHLDVDHWLIGRANVRSGDAVAVWQTRDHEGHRGVVALGQVIGEPESRNDSEN